MKREFIRKLGCILAGLLAVAVADGREPTSAERDFFENHVRPLLAEKCYRCHAAKSKKLKAGLYLDTKAGVLKGGDTGPAVVPGKPDESLLIKAVSYEDPDLQMPPRAKLTPQQIEHLRKWVAMGAPDPRTGKAPAPKSETFDIGALRSAHWAWHAPKETPPAKTKNTTWALDPIDRYILAGIEAVGLEPAPPADRATWLRRATFAITGLPPTPEEIRAFLDDKSADAYKLTVKRLLASKRFGEHWAQHWLDLVRFAETRGHEGDFPIPEAYRYRDYVIRAWNSDVPYNQFVAEHVAGDLLDTPRIDPETRTNQSIQGTGFWHLGEAAHSPVDIRGDEADRVANSLDVFSRTFLGLSVGCARCHDHKFDPITQEDYYALCGYLQSSGFHLANVADPETRQTVAEEIGKLRAAEEPRVLRAFADRFDAGAARMDAYLLAARAVLMGAAADAAAKPADLVPKRVTEWVNALKQARKDLWNPLYPYARIAAERDLPPARLEKLKEEILHEWREKAKAADEHYWQQVTVRTVEKGERNYVSTKRPLQESDTVLDYAHVDARTERWIARGHRFGHGPMKPGQPVFGDAKQPIRKVLTAGAAFAPASRFSGMLRTPTFEVTSDKLWYRYTGEADVFLAVDSHRMVSGPLHGVVRQKLKKTATPQWFAHSVRAYIGHRVHVEFTPKGEFSLERVQFCDPRPADRPGPNARLVRLLESPANSTRSLALLYKELLSSTVRELARGELANSDRAADGARLINWVIRHPNLLDPAADKEKALNEITGAFVARRQELEKKIPGDVRALTLLDGSGENEYVHIRGNHKTLAPKPTPRRILTALGGQPDSPPRGSGRLQLARRLTDPKNPLVARVFVNRVWHHLFGRGIVASVDDFGVMGEDPSHPELLDHLALRFIREGWSTKRLIENILLSQTYRMSSQPNPDAKLKDPTNRRLHRMPILRLTGEAIRDSVLAISGRLDPRMYGKGVMVHITPFMRGNRSPGGSGPADGNGRRSIYIEVRRNHLSHFLTTFDKPVPFTTMGRRSVSNSPAQPLVLLNDELVHQQAELWAKRLLGMKDKSVEDRVRRAYLSAFGRPALDWEVKAALEFVETQRTDGDAQLAWKELCHTLLNVKEFIFLK